MCNIDFKDSPFSGFWANRSFFVSVICEAVTCFLFLASLFFVYVFMLLVV